MTPVIEVAWVAILVAAVIILTAGWGVIASKDSHQVKCEKYYGDMPHNKVKEHCKTLLKFEVTK